MTLNTIQNPVRSDKAFHSALLSEATESGRREIIAFLDGATWSHPYQLPFTPGSLESETLSFTLKQDEKILGYAQGRLHPAATRFLPSWRMLNIQRGPIVEDPEFLEPFLHEIQQVGKDLNLLYIDISPDIPLENQLRIGDIWQSLSATPRSTLRIGLTRSEEEILDSYEKGTRYAIRKSEREGIQAGLMSTESDVRALCRNATRSRIAAGLYTDE